MGRKGLPGAVIFDLRLAGQRMGLCGNAVPEGYCVIFKFQIQSFIIILLYVHGYVKVPAF